jgi:hypothetical protein
MDESLQGSAAKRQRKHSDEFEVLPSYEIARSQDNNRDLENLSQMSVISRASRASSFGGRSLVDSNVEGEEPDESS